MLLQQKIRRLHESPFYGVLVEIGAGLPVADAMFRVPGASNTIHEVFCPYSKDAQTELFGLDDHRAVSMEHVLKDMNTLIVKYSGNPKINFIYHSSFQVGAPADGHPVVSTHGWIGVAKKVSGENSDLSAPVIWKTEFAHMSFHNREFDDKPHWRHKMIDEIGDNCVRYLYGFLFDEGLPEHSAIDNLFIGQSTAEVEPNRPIEARRYKVNLVTLQSGTNEIRRILERMSDKTYVCITPSGYMVRLEDVFRDKKNIAVYKGSFMPVTNAHMKMTELYAQKEDGKPTDVVMTISINNFDKGSQEVDSVMWRVSLLNKLGYTVMINTKGYFKDIAAFLVKKFGKPVSFLLGSDTYNRIDFDNDYELKSCYFYVGMRPGITLKTTDAEVEYSILGDFPDISATEVRQMKAEHNVNGVKELVPEAVVEEYLNI